MFYLKYFDSTKVSVRERSNKVWLEEKSYKPRKEQIVPRTPCGVFPPPRGRILHSRQDSILSSFYYRFTDYIFVEVLVSLLAIKIVIHILRVAFLNSSKILLNKKHTWLYSNFIHVPFIVNCCQSHRNGLVGFKILDWC